MPDETEDEVKAPSPGNFSLLARSATEATDAHRRLDGKRKNIGPPSRMGGRKLTQAQKDRLFAKEAGAAEIWEQVKKWLMNAVNTGAMSAESAGKYLSGLFGVGAGAGSSPTPKPGGPVSQVSAAQGQADVDSIAKNLIATQGLSPDKAYWQAKNQVSNYYRQIGAKGPQDMALTATQGIKNMSPEQWAEEAGKYRSALPTSLVGQIGGALAGTYAPLYSAGKTLFGVGDTVSGGDTVSAAAAGTGIPKTLRTIHGLLTAPGGIRAGLSSGLGAGGVLYGLMNAADDVYQGFAGAGNAPGHNYIDRLRNSFAAQGNAWTNNLSEGKGKAFNPLGPFLAMGAKRNEALAAQDAAKRTAMRSGVFDKDETGQYAQRDTTATALRRRIEGQELGVASHLNPFRGMTQGAGGSWQAPDWLRWWARK